MCKNDIKDIKLFITRTAICLDYLANIKVIKIGNCRDPLTLGGHGVREQRHHLR